MPIIQAAAVEAETMELLAKKAKFEDEFYQLTNQIKDRHIAIAELQAREKAFQDSFIGNEEWLKRIKELRTQYNNEQAIYDTVCRGRELLEVEVTHIKETIDGQRASLAAVKHEKDIMQNQLDSIKLENDALKRDNSMTRSVLVDAKAELETLRTQATEMKETFAKKMQEIYGKEADLASKERDLRVYEERIIREYALLFPDVGIKV